MYSDLQVFRFDEQGVRVVKVNCEPWFVVKDVCDVLGIKNASDVVRKILHNNEIRKEFIPIDLSYRNSERTGKRKMLLTNESGLYTLIMRSDKEEAIGFRCWVTNEVLPSVMRTGSYTLKRDVIELRESSAEKEIKFSAVNSGLQVSLTISCDIRELSEVLRMLGN